MVSEIGPSEVRLLRRQTSVELEPTQPFAFERADRLAFAADAALTTAPFGVAPVA
jgi:hypothetical protein